jgi:uncharacterized protein (TIGR02118 family)
MIKLTVLYGHPDSPDDFEEYYATTHMEVASAMKGYEKVEYTKFFDSPDGSKASYYRMAEFWFNSPGTLQATMDSKEGKTTSEDLLNFATGGFTLLIGETTN